MTLYPFISNQLYEQQADSMIRSYRTASDETEEIKRAAMRKEAEEYNHSLIECQVRLTDPFNGTASGHEDGYRKLLSFDASGMMGYIEIPDICVYLPVYHGTAAETLENGIGHLEGSSLPVGGTDTHAVLSGHTGLNKAKFFTDLVQVEEGDIFYIHILGDTLAYQVCQIQTVLPEDTSGLTVQKGRDLVTLLTCTPYGINSHRLLVTGERIALPETETDISESPEPEKKASLWMQAYKRALFIGLSCAALFVTIYSGSKKAREKRRM